MKADTYISIECSENKVVQQSLATGEIIEEIWSVAPGIRYISGKVSFKKRDRIRLFCTIVPKTETIWMGLMYDDSRDIRYVEGKHGMNYIFTVPQDGEYYIFVQNCGGQDVMVTVTYGYD